MKSFFKKHQQLIIELIVFVGILIALFVIMRRMHLTFGLDSADFEKQHIRFIDYLRNSFWKTHDLAPQITFNYGGTQSMSTLYYYGQYNPLIMLSYLFPFINTLTWMQIVTFIIIVSTFFSMNVLLRRFKIEHKYVLSISVLCAFSPAILYHSAYHIMFVYYFPVMVFSLYALDLLIKNRIKWPFIICVALIFYTNFFFALIIGFVQLIFYLMNLYFINNFDTQKQIQTHLKLLSSYIVGILIGMLAFLPQFYALFGGSRATKVPIQMDLIYVESMRGLTLNAYAAGLSIIGLFVILLGFLNYKNKIALLLSCSMVLVFFSTHFNYLLNGFQYAHYKIFIYTVPLFFFALAYYLNNKELKYKKIGLLLSLIICIITYRSTVLDINTDFSNQAFMLTLAAQFVLLGIFVIRDFKFNKFLIAICVALCVYGTINFSTLFITPKDYRKIVMKNYLKAPNYVVDKKVEFYRSNTAINFSPAINEYAPLSYVSIPNDNYLEFFDEFLNVERYRFSRLTKPSALNNQLTSRFLGITKFRTNSRKVVREYTNVRPFIYGVTNDHVFAENKLTNLNNFERLLGLNDAFFTTDSSTNYDFKKPDLKKLYRSKTNFTEKTAITKNIAVPKEFQKKGLFIVRLNVVSKEVTRTKITVNSHSSYLRPINLYREPEQKEVSLYLDARPDVKNLAIQYQGSPMVYGQLTIDFINQDEINRYDLPYIKTTNDTIDYNKSYSFDLNMTKAGFLGTSIFYDSGFIVKADGKKVVTEKVNHNFLGAKLPKGKHHIEITYEMPGFKVGAVLSFIGLFILAFIMVSEIKFLNKQFFRFVLVGVCNTINYYIAYSLLFNILPYLVSHIIGFIISALISYFLTTIYTFRTKPSLKTFIAFPLTFLPNLVLSSLGTAAFVELHIFDKSVASLIMMILIIPLTFLINKIIFSKKTK